MHEAAYEVDLVIAAEHPALAGHFPGHPIVPGVLLLDAILAAAEGWLGELTLRRMPQAKFLRPLLPAEKARLRLQRQDDTLNFDVRLAAAGHGSVAVAIGRFIIGSVARSA